MLDVLCFLMFASGSGLKEVAVRRGRSTPGQIARQFVCK